ncbi:MAG TPA: TaqI-like C-terminal specificity domain-containing protein, partial [bacterium]|nr:TaqI-like C-terminal specificity domain-containing protein [bacterium]
KTFGKRLEQSGESGCRKKTCNNWFEVQDSIAYYAEFEKEKIVWGNLALDAQYALAEKGMFASAPCPVITPGNKYILAVLNSKVADYFIRKLGVTRNGGYFEYKPMFVEKLPVPQISKEQQKPFERLVDYILFLKEKDIHPLFVSMFETVINSLVYDLYFEEETKAHNLYVSDFVPKYLVSLKHEMTDDEKIQICEKMYRALKNNDELTRAIINRNNSNLIKTIQGEADVAKN